MGVKNAKRKNYHRANNYYGDGNRYVIEFFPFPDALHAVKLTPLKGPINPLIEPGPIYPSNPDDL